MFQVRIADKVENVQYFAVENGIGAPEYFTHASAAQAIANARNAGAIIFERNGFTIERAGASYAVRFNGAYLRTIQWSDISAEIASIE